MARAAHIAWQILSGPRFLFFFIIPNLAFWTVAYFTQATTILPVLSLAITCVGVAACVAYAPGVVGFYARRGWPGTGELLNVGIWLAWAVTAAFGVLSFVWRLVGQPLWLINNDLVAYLRFALLCAGFYHVLTPRSLYERIPEERWIRNGAIAGVATLVFLIVCYYLGLYEELPKAVNHE